MSLRIPLLFLFFLTGLCTSAQTPVQNFTLLNVADSSDTSLDHYTSHKGMVLIFTSNACPYDAYYLERIRTLVNMYQGKIQFLLINSHPDPDEAVEKMKAAYRQWGLTVPYLADKSQVAMESLGARKSPEAFLLKPVGGKFMVIYSGAIDDNPQVMTAVSQHYLHEAIEALIGGHKTEIPKSRAVGCSIRKK
jgi:hypothetical protein